MTDNTRNRDATELCQNALPYDDRLHCVLVSEDINHGCVFWNDKLAVGVKECIVLYDCAEFMNNIKLKSLREDFNINKVPPSKLLEKKTTKKNGLIENKWTAHADLVRCMVVWKKHDKLISGSWDSTLKMWNTNLTCERAFEKHPSYVLCAVIWEKYDLLCSVCYQGNVRMWSFDGVCQVSVEGTPKVPIYSICVYDDYICGGARDGNLWFWDHTGKQVDKIHETTQDVKGMIQFGGKLLTNTMRASSGMIVWEPTKTPASEHLVQKQRCYLLNAEGFAVMKLTPEKKPLLVDGFSSNLVFWNENLDIIGCTCKDFLAGQPRTLDWHPTRKLLSVGCNGALYVFKSMI